VHGSRTGRSTTLALRDGDRGIIAVCHAGCTRTDIFVELRRRGLLGGPERDCPAPVPHRADYADYVGRRIVAARRIWDATKEARGTPVMLYLADRGIFDPPPPALRYAPSLRRPDSTYAPAIVARVDNIDGELSGIHRTWLDRDEGGRWRRRDRGSLGPISGGGVRLAPAANTMMVGEGIETTLTAMQACSLPGWAALSTSGMVALALPPIVRTVIILTDNDVNGAGERAARTAAQRWLSEGRRVRIAIPPEPGTDFADMLAHDAYVDLGNVAA
jgi:hypothetical protein